MFAEHWIKEMIRNCDTAAKCLMKVWEYFLFNEYPDTEYLFISSK